MNEDDDLIEAPVESLQRLPRVRAPSRDLWPGIASRLRPRRRSSYPLVQLALAASLVVGLASVFTLSLGPLGTGPGEPAAAVLPLSHDSRAIVEANLSIVRHAERELRRALEQHPDSPDLRSLLASTENRQRALSALL
ncbi:MAG: hypothetical protein ACRES8_04940 [Nevskiaceae bacterium]